MQPALAVLGALLLATGALAARVKGVHGLINSNDPECAPQQVCCAGPVGGAAVSLHGERLESFARIHMV
jgi:hypothetical protein